MAYTPTEWTDGEALAATKFNKMENGLKSADSSYVPTTWSAGDVITAEKLNKIENGIADAVEASVTVESLSVTQNDTYTAPEGKAYSPITVAVPNTYAAGDEGKVVSNGALVAQTSDTVTENGTVDTTLINSLEVNVSGGGGNPVAEEKDVNFIDYDGTIRYSYTAQEFAALDALPANPNHTDEGLTAQGWNWTLTKAQAQVAEAGFLDIGQLYVTADGKTRLYIELKDLWTEPRLFLCPNGTTVIDWGDGSDPDTITGTSLTTLIGKGHQYASAGHYVISLAVTGRLAIMGRQSSGMGGNGATPIRYNGQNTGLDGYYSFYSLKKVRLGSNIELSTYAFADCYSLESITIASDTRLKGDNVGGRIFSGSPRIKCLILPNNSYYGGLSQYMLAGSYADHLVISENSASIADGCFNQQYGSPRITINKDATAIPSYFLSTAKGVTKIVVPSAVTTIANYGIYASAALLSELRFNPLTPPTCGGQYALAAPTTCVLIVPYSALAAYLTAQYYPSPASRTYLGFATYANGATLPTQDSTEAYNVVWYATKADAIAQTNPITQGNGNEIYCRYVAVA